VNLVVFSPVSQQASRDKLQNETLSLTAVSFFLVFMYMWFNVESLFLACMGMMQVLFSVFPTVTIWDSLINQQGVQFLQLIAVFMILGIGADTIFVLNDTFKQVKHELQGVPGITRIHIFSVTYRRAVSAMLATTMTTSLAFFFGIFNPIPVIADFCIFACIIVISNFLYCITFGAACVAFQDRFMAGHLCCCCGGAPAPGSCGSPGCCFGGTRKVFRKVRGISADATTEERALEVFFAGPLFRFLKRFKYPLILFWVGVLIAAGISAALGVKIADKDPEGLPEDHPEQRFAKLMGEYFLQPEPEIVRVLWGLKDDGPVSEWSDTKGNTPNKIEFMDIGAALSPEGQNGILSLCRAPDAEAGTRRCTNKGCLVKGSSTPCEYGTRNGMTYTKDPLCQSGRYCIMEQVKQYADLNGLAFPLADFHGVVSGTQFQDFMKEYWDALDETKQHWHKLNYKENTGLVLEGGKVKYMWVSFNATFEGRFLPPAEGNRIYDDWQDFISMHAGGTKFFQVHIMFLFKVLQDVIVEEAFKSIGCSLAVALAVLTLVTWNWFLAMLGIFNLVSILTCFLGMWPMLGWQLDIFNVIFCIMSVGLSVDYTVHLVHTYNACEAPDREARVRHALSVMGITVVSGATTTLMAALPLLFTIPIFYQRFGSFVFMCIWLSILTSIFFLIPMLLAIGPAGTFGDIKPLYMLQDLMSGAQSKPDRQDAASAPEKREKDSIMFLIWKLLSLASHCDLCFALLGFFCAILVGWCRQLATWCIMALMISVLIGGENEIGRENETARFRETLPILCSLLAVYTCSSAGVLGTFQRFKKKHERVVRRLCFSAVMHQDMCWYDVQNIQGLPEQLNQDCTQIAEAFGEKVCGLLTGLTVFLAGIFVAFYKGWLLTLVILAVSPVMFFGLHRGLAVMAAAANQSQEHFSHAAAVIEECFYAMQAIVSMGKEARVLQECRDAFERVRCDGVRSSWRKGVAMAVWSSSPFLMSGLCFFAGMMLRYHKVENHNSGLPYDVFDVIICFMVVYNGAMALGGVAPGLQAMREAAVAGARVFAIVDNYPEISRNPSTDPEERKSCTEIKTITFENVYFSYPTKRHLNILKGTSLTIHRGQKVVFVGQSGCGKSTLMALLARYYDPLSGRVLINDENLRKYSIGSLRSLMGYVGQEPVLFAGSLRDNFLRVCPSATDDEIGHALEQAECSFVKNLPDGLDTYLGSSGSQFSGGQKHQVAIARVLVKKPQTLLLDEATSALDNKSERKIQATLDMIGKRSVGKLTMISISNRLSTIMGSDVIYYFKEGRVLEYGTHVALIAKRGAYYSMVEQNANLFNAQETDSEAASDNEEQAEQEESTFSAPINSRSKRGKCAPISLGKDKLRDMTKSPLSRLLDFCKPEWKYFVLCVLSAFVVGATIPYCSMAFVRVIEILMEKDFDVMVRKMGFEYMGFAFAGTCAFLARMTQFGCMGIVGEAMAKRLRASMLNSMIRMDLGFYDNPKNAPSALGYKLQMLPHRVIALTDGLASNFTMVGAILVGLGIGFYRDWRVALTTLVSFPLTLGLTLMRVKSFRGTGSGMTEPQRKAQQVLAEAVQNPKAIQALACEEATLGLYTRFLQPVPLTCKLASCNFMDWVLYGLSNVITLVIFVCAQYLSADLVFHHGASYSDTQQAVQAVLGALAGMSVASAAVGDAALAKEACKEIFELLDGDSPIDGLEPTGSIPPAGIEVGCIEFRLVNFAYPFRPAIPILKSMAFKVPHGTSVGLVGPSGGGKSTVFNLIQRFYDPDSGQVLIGRERIPLETINIRWWRSQIGFVGQEAIMFNTNVLDNVLYGVEQDAFHNMDKLEDYKKMCALEFLDGPGCDGWNTQVGPKGFKLSDGQRQRISICRAMMRDPPVLLLDEATSALDNKSEELVSTALKEAMKGRTSFSIAHRLSTVEGCDLILVCVDGQVFEQGNDAELMMMEGVYAQLQTAQGKEPQTACA